MRKSGWPNANNPPILNQNPSGYYDDSIVFRSSDSYPTTVIGTFVAPGTHLELDYSVTGFPRLNVYAICLKNYTGAIRVMKQDGSEDVYTTTDWTVRRGVYQYNLGDTLWYNIFDPSGKQTGILTGLTGSYPNITTFTLRDTVTGVISTVPLANALIDITIPANKVTVESIYNQH
jgi:hypothetical protein